MPVVYEIEQGSGLVRTSCIGEVTFAEVLDHFRILENDPQRPATLDVLLDLSEMSSMPQPGQLRAVSQEMGSLPPTVQFRACAMVASRDVIFGLARMFEAFASGRFEAIRVCRSRAEAEEWLASPRTSPPGSDAG